MIQFLALTVIGKYDAALPERLTGAIAECDCNIRESRISILGQEFSMMLLLSGNWNAVVKVEDALNRLGKEQDLSINMRRTELNKSQKNLMPYAIDVVCSDRVGVVNRITASSRIVGFKFAIYTLRHTKHLTPVPRCSRCT